MSLRMLVRAPPRLLPLPDKVRMYTRTRAFQTAAPCRAGAGCQKCSDSLVHNAAVAPDACVLQVKGAGVVAGGVQAGVLVVAANTMALDTSTLCPCSLPALPLRPIPPCQRSYSPSGCPRQPAPVPGECGLAVHRTAPQFKCMAPQCGMFMQMLACMHAGAARSR